MNLYEDGIADDETAKVRSRRAVPAVAASLVVAFFAYLGIAIGGGFGTLASADTSGFSTGKNTQPLYLSLRDVARGMVAAERSVEPKASWHDGNAALLPAPPSLSLANATTPLGGRPVSAPPLSPASLAYLARAPPAFAG